ncbi:hypothetical protein FGADI_5433 [Fusarium gaditjirri]|uniref:DUF7918 domain-containing protein n=1 Tax=Fusarium gaditjirri TaxID=282569 RepID=A0A8H4TA84_9HYPO|nr:hypothetical protein FGADI_5433 [Fusarium gaditjirri]
MAIIKAVPHFEVQVKVGDSVANEWPMPADDTNVSETPSISKYIESETGARISIQLSQYPGYTLPEGADRLGIKIYVDGEQWETLEMKIQKHGCTETLGERIFRMHDGEYIKQYPIFSNIISDEEADLARVEADKLLIKKLGKIEVVLSAFRARGFCDPDEGFDNIGHVSNSEVSHKAMITSGEHLSHRICPEDVHIEEEYIPYPVLDCVFVEDIAKYHFQYSSHRPMIGERGFALPAALSPLGTPRLLPQHRYPETQQPGGIPCIDLTQDED